MSSTRPLAALFAFIACGAAARPAHADFFVADQANNRIIRVDENTGDMIDVLTTGLASPSALSWGPGGFLYAANFAAYAGPGSPASVVRIDPVTGVIDNTFAITTIPGPGGLGYDSINAPNSIFVSELATFGFDPETMQPTVDFNGDEVHRFNASGVETAVIGTGSAATGRSGITFDVDGNLYVTDFSFFGVGSVLKYDYDGVSDYTAGGTYASGAGVAITPVPGAFINPPNAGGLNGLAFNDSGELYVAALTGTALLKYTAAPTVTGSQADGTIPYPSGVLVEGSQDVVLTSLGNNNAMDPFYPGNLFPGTLLRYHADTNVVTPVLVGDANRDNTVDGADLAVITGAYGLSAAGDLDGDADTDGDDILLWQRSLGNSLATGSFLPTGIVRYVEIIAAPVPEPAAASLACVCLAALAAARRRRA